MELSLKAKKALEDLGNFTITSDLQNFKGHLNGRVYYDYSDLILMSEGLKEAAEYLKFNELKESDCGI